MSLKERSVSQMNIKTPRVPPRHLERPDIRRWPTASHDEGLHDPALAQQIQKSPSGLRRNSGVGHEVGALEDRILENPIQRVDRVARSGQIGQPTRRPRSSSRCWANTVLVSTCRFTAHPAPRRAAPARSGKVAGETDEGRGPRGSGRPGAPSLLGRDAASRRTRLSRLVCAGVTPARPRPVLDG